MGEHYIYSLFYVLDCYKVTTALSWPFTVGNLDNSTEYSVIETGNVWQLCCSINAIHN